MIWGEFGLHLVLIMFFGWKISVLAEKLSIAKNLGRGLVGFVLLGFTTSLPELITTMTSVLHIENTQLGAGNIIGSNNANMLILFFSVISVSSLMKEDKVDRENLVAVAFLFMMLGVFLAGTAMEISCGFSIYGLIIAGLFFFSIKAIKKVGDQDNIENNTADKAGLGPLFYFKLSASALFLVLVSWRTSFVVDSMTGLYNWNSTSAGALFLAWATSLPELAVTVSAIIIGAKELGIGNILGSNIFNMFVLALADIFSGKKLTVFRADSRLMVFTGMLIIMSSGLIIMLSAKENKKIFGITVIPAIMIMLYFAGMIFSF